MPDSFRVDIHASTGNLKSAGLMPLLEQMAVFRMDTVSPILIGLINYTPRCPPRVHQVL